MSPFILITDICERKFWIRTDMVIAFTLQPEMKYADSKNEKPIVAWMITLDQKIFTTLYKDTEILIVTEEEKTRITKLELL